MEIVCPSCSDENAYFNGVSCECSDCGFSWGEVEIEKDEKRQRGY